jgi:hypothetical protein
VAVGDIVEAIDGRAVREVIAENEALISAASPGYRRVRALEELALGDVASVRRLALVRTDGMRVAVEVALMPSGEVDVQPPRPQPIAELEPGLYYVDLTRFTPAEFDVDVERLASAQAIVFDMRGYPGDDAETVLQHLADAPLASNRFNVPRFTQPDQRAVTFTDRSWRLEPLEPHIAARSVFLTDASVISYGESVMGIVEQYHLGEIVGATTAGTNGDMNMLFLPTGHTIIWTGTQVLKHDGGRFHGVGAAYDRRSSCRS